MQRSFGILGVCVGFIFAFAVACGDPVVQDGDASVMTDSAVVADDAYVFDTANPDTIVVGGPCDGFYTSKVFGGFANIENSDNLLPFAGIECITGRLLVDATGFTQLSELASLKLVGGSVEIRNTQLTSIRLPALTSVGLDLMIHDNLALTSCELPVLASVGEHLDIVGNRFLTSFELPLLTSVGLDLRLFTPGLTSIRLPLLAAVGGGLAIHDNDGLTSLSLPVLTSVGDLYIYSNNVLTSISLPALAMVRGFLNIYGNPALPRCAATNLCDQVRAADGIGNAIDISDNDEDICEPEPCSSGTCAEDCSVAEYFVCQ